MDRQRATLIERCGSADDFEELYERLVRSGRAPSRVSIIWDRTLPLPYTTLAELDEAFGEMGLVGAPLEDAFFGSDVMLCWVTP